MNKEELIDKYLAGDLSKDEKTDFEEQIKNDPSLAEEVEFRRELKFALKKTEHKQIRQLLSEAQQSKVRTKSIRWPVYLAAASIVFILMVGWWFFVLNSQPDLNELYVAYYEPYENVVHPIERSESIKTLETEAFLAYESGEYQEAKELFNKLREERNEPYIQLYLGITLMSMQDFSQATDYLNDYIKSNGKLKDRAMWYLALAYLKSGEKAKAVNTLKDLIALDGYNRYKAEELLSKID